MMFVAINLVPAGSMTSRADLLGYTDDEIKAVQAGAAHPSRVSEVNNALQYAARALHAREAYGSVH